MAIALKPEDRWHAAFLAASVALAFVCAWVAYCPMFGFYGPLDDEGYILISLKSFLAGRRLYDEIFTQYGPVYFECLAGLFRMVAMPMDHDHARWVALVLWVSTSLFAGLLVERITRAPIVALAAQITTFLGLVRDRCEPLHPGGLLALALVLLALALTTTKTRLGPARGLAAGVLVSAMVLTKINTGLFAACSIGWALLSVTPVSGRRVVLAMVGALLVLLPFALMGRLLGEPEVEAYAILVSASTAAIVVVSMSDPPIDAVRPSEWLGASLGFGLVLVLGPAIALGLGSSLPALVDGVLLRALRHPGVFHTPLILPPETLTLVGLGFVSALGYAWLARRVDARSRLVLLTPLLQISLGAVGFALFVLDTEELKLAALLPFAWLGLASSPDLELSPMEKLARRCLVALAVLQALHAYPVAGSQIDWSSFLLVSTCAVALADGARGLWRGLEARGCPLPGLRLRGVGRSLALAWVVGLALGTHARFEPEARAFESRTPLGLRGAERLRFAPESSATLRWLVGRLGSECSGFVALPGLNSLYLFVGMDPPTAMNTTTWMTLFDERTQRAIIERLEAGPRPCAVRNTGLASFWTSKRREPSEGPLERYIGEEMETLEVRDGYELMMRRRKPAMLEVVH